MRQALDDLRLVAKGACDMRGHTLRWIAAVHGENRSTQQGNCTKCPAWVDINTAPRANQIDIGGPAVALDCPAIPEEG